MLFVIETICGVMILAGAALQYSGGRQKVRLGSPLILTSLIAGIPSTYAGELFGGALSAIGAALGPTWKLPDSYGP
ncbi:MAG: hypothetical protein JRN21_04285 [Nitrososphaerota archaeon]|nr:hypothetical protein [Nitrososphaerota archaeon]